MLGVTSRYTPGTAGGKKTLPKAKITLELPSQPEYREHLENEHLLFRNKLGDWNSFIAPYQKDSANPNRLEIDSFVLENVQRSHRSRSQIVETNESAILFMYGEQALVYNFALRLMDGGENLSGEKFDWLDKLERFYERFSGQVIADYNMDFRVSFKRRSYKGVWLNFDIQEESDFDRAAGVTFQMFVVEKNPHLYTINGR
jgi:hypothetical protein